MKRVTIMIGIPGSGKSTLARMLHGSIVSADNFHLDKDGQYNYRHELAGQAHLWCLETFIRLLEKGERHIIVDNTNTRNFERAPYVQMAKLYGYVVEFMKMSASPEEAHERCVHGLSLEQVQAMHDRMEELPSYWEAPRDGARILDARLASCEPVDTDVITDALQKAYDSADPRPKTEAEFTEMIEEVLDPGVIWHMDSFTPTGVGLFVQGPFTGRLMPSGSVSALVRIHRRQHAGFIISMSEPLELFDPTLGFDNPPVIVNGETYRPKAVLPRHGERRLARPLATQGPWRAPGARVRHPSHHLVVARSCVLRARWADRRRLVHSNDAARRSMARRALAALWRRQTGRDPGVDGREWFVARGSARAIGDEDRCVDEDRRTTARPHRWRRGALNQTRDLSLAISKNNPHHTHTRLAKTCARRLTRISSLREHRRSAALVSRWIGFRIVRRSLTKSMRSDPRSVHPA